MGLVAALAPRDLADWMVRQVATSAQVVLDAAGSWDSAAAGATAAGLQRVDLDRVGLAAAPGAAARRTQMRLQERGLPGPDGDGRTWVWGALARGGLASGCQPRDGWQARVVLGSRSGDGR